MDFSLSVEEREIRDWVRTFVQKELIPLEPEVLRRERAHQPGLTSDELTELQQKAKASGFWGVQTRGEYGGLGLAAVMAALLAAGHGRTFVPLRLGGSSGNVHRHGNVRRETGYRR